MTPQEFYKILLLDFPFNPTNEQDRALESLADFIIDKNKDRLFMLRGYAGTRRRGRRTQHGGPARQSWNTSARAWPWL